MKPPISYYGGKSNMLKHILPKIPAHTVYVEPFFGSGAVFWAKPKSKVEVINDINDNLINFYRVMKTDFEALQREIECTLHSRSLYEKSKEIYLNPDQHSDLMRAWAVWVQCSISFATQPLNGFDSGFSIKKHTYSPRSTQYRVSDFLNFEGDRISDTLIENNNAIDLILRLNKRTEAAEYFYYLDPPYPESDCGHYEKEKDVYYRLLEILPLIKGRFLMSSYPSSELDSLRDEMGLNFENIVMNKSMTNGTEGEETKTECLSWNYQIDQLSLF